MLLPRSVLELLGIIMYTYHIKHASRAPPFQYNLKRWRIAAYLNESWRRRRRSIFSLADSVFSSDFRSPGNWNEGWGESRSGAWKLRKGGKWERFGERERVSNPRFDCYFVCVLPLYGIACKITYYRERGGWGWGWRVIKHLL